MTNNMTNNMAGPLNRIVLTFTEEDVEAFQYKDKIKTTTGETFITLKKFINYYTNEEKKRQEMLINEEKQQRDMLLNEEKQQRDILLKELCASKEYKEKVSQEQENQRKKYREDIKTGKLDQDIKLVMDNVPEDISRAEIIEMLIREEGDFVNAIMELNNKIE